MQAIPNIKKFKNKPVDIKMSAHDTYLEYPTSGTAKSQKD